MKKHMSTVFLPQSHSQLQDQGQDRPTNLSLVLLQTLLPHHLGELVVADGPVPVEVRLHDELQDLVLRRVLPD